MSSASRRLREGADPDRALNRRRSADKAELGWTHAFTPPARLRVSLSHEVTAGRFGGGNVRFVGVF